MNRCFLPECVRAGSGVLILQGMSHSMLCTPLVDSSVPSISSTDEIKHGLHVQVLTGDLRRGHMRILTKQVYAILDEIFLAGEIEETSKQVVLDRLDYLEKLE